MDQRTLRILLLLESAANKSPPGLQAKLLRLLKEAAVAGTPSMRNPPPPATVDIIPAEFTWCDTS